MPKYQIVLRHNPSGKAAAASKGRKIRSMGPYASKSAAVADAKALKTKQGVAVVVEPAPAPRIRTTAQLNTKLKRKATSKKSKTRTGPSRGLSVGAVSNPRKRGARGSRSTSATAPAYLKFDGKRYTRYRKTWYTRKAEAAARAKKLRKAGNVYARIDHQASGYMVYVRKKPAALRNPAPEKKAKATSGKVKPVGRIRRVPAGAKLPVSVDYDSVQDFYTVYVTAGRRQVAVGDFLTKKAAQAAARKARRLIKVGSTPAQIFNAFMYKSNPSDYQRAMDADAFRQWQLAESEDAFFDDYFDADASYGAHESWEDRVARVAAATPTRDLLRVRDRIRRTAGVDPREVRRSGLGRSTLGDETLEAAWEPRALARELRKRRAKKNKGGRGHAQPGLWTQLPVPRKLARGLRAAAISNPDAWSVGSRAMRPLVKPNGDHILASMGGAGSYAVEVVRKPMRTSSGKKRKLRYYVEYAGGADAFATKAEAMRRGREVAAFLLASKRADASKRARKNPRVRSGWLHAGPSTHRHGSRQAHGPAGVISNPRKLSAAVYRRVHEEGQVAKAMGAPRKDCPYPRSRKDLRSAWLDGWEHGVAKRNPSHRPRPSAGPGIWERSAAGEYTRGDWAIKKERVRSRGRMVQRWALYKFNRARQHGPDSSRWVLLAHFQTLKDAKATADARFRRALERLDLGRGRYGY
jgi:ribosome modulation factor